MGRSTIIEPPLDHAALGNRADVDLAGNSKGGMLTLTDGLTHFHQYTDAAFARYIVLQIKELPLRLPLRPHRCTGGYARTKYGELLLTH